MADQLERATSLYQTVSQNRDVAVQAEALFRQGRVYRRRSDLRQALETYQRLAALDGVRTSGLPPAVVVGWLVTRDWVETQPEVTSALLPDSWRLAEVLDQAWQGWNGSPPASGQRFANIEGRPVLVMWRSNGRSSAVLLAFSQHFLARACAGECGLRAFGFRRPLAAGDAAAPARAVTRVLNGFQYAWTLRLWPADPEGMEAAGGTRRTVLTAMLIAMLSFLLGAAYFMARLIQREAQSRACRQTSSPRFRTSSVPR